MYDRRGALREALSISAQPHGFESQGIRQSGERLAFANRPAAPVPERSRGNNAPRGSLPLRGLRPLLLSQRTRRATVTLTRAGLSWSPSEPGLGCNDRDRSVGSANGEGRLSLPCRP